MLRRANWSVFFFVFLCGERHVGDERICVQKNASDAQSSAFKEQASGVNMRSCARACARARSRSRTFIIFALSTNSTIDHLTIGSTIVVFNNQNASRTQKQNKKKCFCAHDSF